MPSILEVRCFNGGDVEYDVVDYIVDYVIDYVVVYVDDDVFVGAGTKAIGRTRYFGTRKKSIKNSKCCSISMIFCMSS